MTLFLMTPPPVPDGARPRNRAPVWLWVLVNLLAFPGLGTIMMRRRAGYYQASMMVAGFVLAMGYLLWFIACAVRYAGNPAWTEADFTGHYRPYQWALGWGLALCGIAWVWALVSSVQILKAQKPSP